MALSMMSSRRLESKGYLSGEMIEVILEDIGIDLVKNHRAALEKRDIKGHPKKDGSNSPTVCVERTSVSLAGTLGSSRTALG
jgi:hypothetical protein